MKILVTAVLLLIISAQDSLAGSAFSGDIVIQSNDKNGNFYCDGLICPKNTHSCEVTKRNDPKNFQQIIRTKKCFSADGQVVQKAVVKEANTSGGIVNAQAMAYGNSGGGGFNAAEAQRKYGPLPTFMPNIFGRK